jgi:hypothetical protein
VRWFARQGARVRWIVACALAAQAILIAGIASVVTTAGLKPAFQLSAAPETGMTSVSCIAAGDCLAVGWKYAADDSGTGIPLAARWGGSRWQPVSVSLPAGVFSAQLASVSCNADGCLAVGTYRIGGGRDYPLAASWTGHGWILSRLPVPAGGIPLVRSAYLNTVSCPSASNCIAVGEYYMMETNAEGMFTETWNGAGWTISAIPSPAGASATLDSVTCRAATSCLAVGSVTARGATTSDVLIEALNGSTWTPRAAPGPGGGMSASLESVSCSSAISCVAVGVTFSTGESSTPTTTAFTEVLSGTTWTPHAVPVPLGRDSSLGGVSCISPADCFAVGRTMAHVNHDYGYPYVLAWNGFGWSPVPVPTVPMASKDFWAGNFDSLACMPGAPCVALGWEGPIHATDSRGLAGIWAGPR